MSFFGGILNALGFESEQSENSVKKKNRKIETKASFNLKKDKIEKPDKIDGVRVVYLENKVDFEKALSIFKSGEPVLINYEYAADKSYAKGYFEGVIKMTRIKLRPL